MTDRPEFDIFLVCTPGLEDLVAAEARENGFGNARVIAGGVAATGTRDDIIRANMTLRGPTRVLMRIAEFRAMHPAQLDKRARRVAWADFLRPDIAVRVDAACRKSRIYHAGAAATRVAQAINETLGAPIAADARVTVKVRIDDDLCVISLDTTGESLHRRGHKLAVGKAPMRENMAAMLLRACGWHAGEPLYDPMCGSGTFVIEAAEITAGFAPGRSRSFAFDDLAGFVRVADAVPPASAPIPAAGAGFFGSDRDAGAIEMSRSNADRAGVGAITEFVQRPVSDMRPPCADPGLVIVNPPYGGRIGKTRGLYPLYGAMGAALAERFAGWRVGLVTTDAGLARSTSLPFLDPGPFVAHGPLKIRLWQTPTLR